MKESTKKQIIKKEVSYKLKKKATTTKVKQKKERIYIKVNTIDFDITKNCNSLVASYYKTLNIADDLKQYKKESKTNILANSNLTDAQKMQILAYKKVSVVDLKAVDKTLKNEYKSFCIKILKENLKDSKNIDKTTFYISEEDKSELLNFIKSIFKIEYNFTYAMLKNAMLSGFNNSLKIERK